MEFINRTDTYNIGVGGGRPLKGRIFSKETRDKLSIIAKHRVFSEKTRKKMSNSAMGNTATLGLAHTKEAREKISKSLIGNTYTLGHKLTDKHKEKLRIASTNNPKLSRIVICPHCGKTGGICAMKRHHFDNCKYN